MRLQVTRAPEKFISLGIFLNSGASNSTIVCDNNSRQRKQHGDNTTSLVCHQTAQ